MAKRKRKIFITGNVKDISAYCSYYHINQVAVDFTYE